MCTEDALVAVVFKTNGSLLYMSSTHTTNIEKSCTGVLSMKNLKGIDIANYIEWQQ